MNIRLETRAGEFVSYATIADYFVPPEIVRWGERLFVLHSSLVSPALYREAVVGVVPDPTPRDTPDVPAA